MENDGSSWRSTPLPIRILATASGIASILAVVSTMYISWNANRLQQGDNTINVITAYGSETVRASRSALYDIARQETVDPAGRAYSFIQVAPVRGTLGLVATCYRDGLCLSPTIIDYFCVDVLKFDETFGSGSPDVQRIVPDAADVAFNALVNDCRHERGGQ